jgi:multidrug resistance efflux pump
MPLEGTWVKKGERLLEFDSSSLQTQVEEVQRRVDEAKLRIDKQKADLEAQRQDLLIDVSAQQTNVKIAKLYAGIEKELLPENQYQKYKVDLERAELALQKANERLANFENNYSTQMGLVELNKAQADLDQKKIQGDLELLTMDAPQDGVVVYGDNWASNRKVQIGDNLFVGQPVMSLPDLSQMRVVSFVYDTEVQRMKTGTPAQITLDAIPGKSWKGKVTSLTSIAVRKGFASRHKVFKATVDFDQADFSLMKPGMTARVEIPYLLGQQVIAIPREFLHQEGSGSFYVYKPAPEKGKENLKVAVRVGTFNARMIEIIDGLKAGETIYQ